MECFVFSECSFDDADGLEELARGVVFDAAWLCDVDGADVADPAQVVSHEVDDHGEFGAFLWAALEVVVRCFGGDGVGRVGAAGAFHGAGLDASCLMVVGEEEFWAE